MKCKMNLESVHLTAPGAHFKTTNKSIRYPANKCMCGEEIME